MLLSFLLCNFLKSFLPTKSWKNHPKKLHTYGSWEVFFSAAPTAQNSPELHFRFINSFIQPSLVGSLIPSVPVFLIIPSPQLDHVSSPFFLTSVRQGQIGNMCRTKLIRNGYGLRDSKLHCNTGSRPLLDTI